MFVTCRRFYMIVSCNYEDAHKIRIHMSLGCTARLSQIATAEGKLEERATEYNWRTSILVMYFAAEGCWKFCFVSLWSVFVYLLTYVLQMTRRKSYESYIFYLWREIFVSLKVEVMDAVLAEELKWWNGIPNSSWPTFLTISSKSEAKSPSHILRWNLGLLDRRNIILSLGMKDKRVETHTVTWRYNGTGRSDQVGVFERLEVTFVTRFSRLSEHSQKFLKWGNKLLHQINSTRVDIFKDLVAMVDIIFFFPLKRHKQMKRTF